LRYREGLQVEIEAKYNTLVMKKEIVWRTKDLRIDKSIQLLLKPRDPMSHKGNYGHALIVAGNTGKMGAAVIASKACLRSGVGLLTVNIPKKERSILQIAVPEAMVTIRENKMNLTSFSAACIGPGIGTDAATTALVTDFLENYKQPLLIDADALNIIAEHKLLLDKLPEGTVLTPHPKEFDRLFGAHTSVEERMDTAIAMAKKYRLVIVLKGHHTLVTYDGLVYINNTGNAGLAKGGSGDALSGIICALLAQGYNTFDAAKMGVHLHGLAADIALANQSMESMLITDVIECLGNAFKSLM